MRPKHIMTGFLLTAAIAAAPDAYGQISYTEQGLTIGTATRPAGTDGQIVISTAKGLEWLNNTLFTTITTLSHLGERVIIGYGSDIMQTYGDVRYQNGTHNITAGEILIEPGVYVEKSANLNINIQK